MGKGEDESQNFSRAWGSFHQRAACALAKLEPFMIPWRGSQPRGGDGPSTGI